MGKFYTVVFLHEIRRQCDFASRAYQDITIALDESDIGKLWYSVQSFLIACGNIYLGRRPKRSCIVAETD